MLQKEHYICNTGYIRKVYRSLLIGLPWNILNYLSIKKLPQKRSRQSMYLTNSHKKIHIIFLFINNINIYFIYTWKYFRVIFISIIMNVHNYPCFEDKSSSITLKDDAISSGTLFRIKLYISFRKIIFCTRFIKFIRVWEVLCM